jgi:hypothetical protein
MAAISLQRVWTRHDLDPRDDRWPRLLSHGSAAYTFAYTPDWADRVWAHVRKHGFGRAGLKDRRSAGGFMDESAVVVATRKRSGGALLVSTVSVKNSQRFPPPPLEEPDAFFDRGTFNLGDAVLLGTNNDPPRIPLDGAVVSVLMPGAESELACVAPKTAKKLSIYRECADDEPAMVARKVLCKPYAAVKIGQNVVRVIDQILDDVHRRKPDVRKRKRLSQFTTRIETTRALGETMKPKRAAVKISSADVPPVLWEAVLAVDRLRIMTGLPWSATIPDGAQNHVDALREAGERDRVEGGSGSMWIDVVAVPVRAFLSGPDWLRGESGCRELFQVLSKASRPAGFESKRTAMFPSCVRPIQSFVWPRKTGGGVLVVDAGTLGHLFIETLWNRFKQTAHRRARSLSDWTESTLEGARAFTAEERQIIRCAGAHDAEPTADVNLDMTKLPPCVRSLLPGGAARRLAESNNASWDHMRNEERMVAAVVLGSAKPKPPVADVEDLLGPCFSNIGTPADKASFRYMYNRPMPKKMFSCGRLIGSAGFSLCPYAKVYGSNGAFLKCTEGCDTSGLRRTPFGAAVARMRKIVKDE